MMSLVVPGPNGETIVIGLVGKSCAAAGIAKAAVPATADAMAARRDNVLTGMNVLPLVSFGLAVELRFSRRGPSTLRAARRKARDVVIAKDSRCPSSPCSSR